MPDPGDLSGEHGPVEPDGPTWPDDDLADYGGGPARSLVEAYVHLDLTVPGDGSGAADRAVLTEEQEGWRVRLDGAEVFVPYAAETEARREELTFGSGISELIDPGQWVLIGATYARRALEAALFFAADPSSDERYRAIVSDWRFAADAVLEALKFVPEGAGELPEVSFWTEMGRAAYESEPARFTRARLEDDLAYYRTALDDFLRLHAEDDGPA
ncbi:hypothetical protein [Streptosporangium amethystogenes]|uniref:hypothetical protein n=1 Tax=Streptosporangium amethystogenes TaxID=2002 RepID=UPI00068F0DD5|nr:hypothetical protein [Streptosporangium amethystogenes]